MATKKRLPSIGHVLTYELSELPRTQKNLRLRTLLRAENAAFLGEDLPLEADRSNESVFISLGIAYLSVLAVLGLFFPLSFIIFLANALMSLVEFFVYWLDKNASESKARRVSETTLQTWALLGGWPGAAIAQKVFRHKTRKASFQNTFRLMVVCNVLVTAVLSALIWLGR